MSLVLEALRKQQIDEDPGAAITVATASERQRRQRTWMVLLTIALLLNAALFAWLFRDRIAGTPAALAPAAQTDQAPVSGTTAGVPATPATAPLPSPPQLQNPAQAAPAPAPAQPAPPPRVLERVPLDSLPPGPRSRFPGIVISTHVFAENPEMRAIVVNGKRLGEGDQVGDLTIREINEYGVVLEFESYLVEVPVFTDW